jgi:hypothetical protein
MQLQTFARYPHAPTIVSRSTDPELKEKGFLVAEHPTRKLAVILHADVVGSTRLESGHGTGPGETTNAPLLDSTSSKLAYPAPPDWD